MLIAFVSFQANASAIAFPPELIWWIDAAKQVNTNISIDAFKTAGNETVSIQTNNKYLTPTFPVFSRWNYTATKYVYFNDGLVLTRESNGKYTVKKEKDTAFYVADNRNKIIYEEHYGSNIDLDGIAWLRDDILIAVSHITKTANDKKQVDLFITQYKLTGLKVELLNYVFESAFDADSLRQMNMNWWQQRPDYFNVNNGKN